MGFSVLHIPRLRPHLVRILAAIPEGTRRIKAVSTDPCHLAEKWYYAMIKLIENGFVELSDGRYAVFAPFFARFLRLD